MAKLQYNAKVYEDTSANLATDETVFRANELIFASDTGEFKRGNGVDVYVDLDAIGAGGNPTQEAAIDALVSPTADYADLTAVTAAVKSVIDALKA